MRQVRGVPAEFPTACWNTWCMLTSMEERELQCPEARPLIGWRLFRVRRSDSGLVLSAPLIHNPDFERFPSRTIEAICYQAGHPAPAPGCRCGLYAAIDGTLDSLPGYLSDSAHDPDPPIYAEVACTGRVFVDSRGVRAQRIQIIQLATPPRCGQIPACRRKLSRNSASDTASRSVVLASCPHGWLRT